MPSVRTRASLLPWALCLVLAWVWAAPAPAGASDHDPAWMERALSLALADGYQVLDSEGMRALVADPQGALLLDVRPDYEFKAGHIAGAVNLEFDLADRQDLSPAKQDRLRALLGPDPQRRVVIYCRSYS